MRFAWTQRSQNDSVQSLAWLLVQLIRRTPLWTHPLQPKTLQLNRVDELQTGAATPKQIIKRCSRVLVFNDTNYVSAPRFHGLLICDYFATERMNISQLLCDRTPRNIDPTENNGFTMVVPSSKIENFGISHSGSVQVIWTTFHVTSKGKKIMRLKSGCLVLCSHISVKNWKCERTRRL